MTYDPVQVGQAISTQRWSAVARTGLDAAAVSTWDPDLLRSPRVLVPVDVQAYVVPRTGTPEACVRMPGPLTPGTSPDAAPAAALAGPPPFAAGSPRPAGVHLHWAVPDALLRSRLKDTEAGHPLLVMPALPDTWAVLRLLAPQQGAVVQVTGQVVLAATAQAVDLLDYPGAVPLPALPANQLLAPEALTGQSGGSLDWAATYDQASGRFTFHDPLDDLAADPALGGALAGGAVAAAATYVVLGWWSRPGLDPLDGVRTEGGLTEALAGLGWGLPPAAAPSTASDGAGPALSKIADLGLVVAQRDGTPPADRSAVAEVRLAGLLGTDAAQVLRGRVTQAPSAATLLHGAVVSVPVDGRAPTDRGLPDLRPDPTAVRTVLGRTGDEMAAAMALPAVTADQGARLDAERLLAAFAGGVLRTLGQPDGIADVDERRHRSGFSARANLAEAGVVDRVRTRVAAVPDRPPRPRSQGTAAAATQVQVQAAQLTFSREKAAGVRVVQEDTSATLARAAASQVTEARSRFVVGSDARAEIVRSAVSGVADQVDAGAARAAAASSRGAADGSAGTADADPGRLVTRPAPPWHVPVEPALTIAGAARSLRHGGDGRFNPDGTLRVRHPEDVVTQYHGLLPGSAVLATLGSGALPDESLALAREAALLSPDWAGWLAGLAAARNGTPVGPVATRLLSEVALRYDATGGYSQTVGLQALAGGSARVGARGYADPRAIVADEALRAHSLLDGVEPSPVGMTAWAQPWVPMWVEWEVAVESADPDAPGDPLTGWELGGVDADPAPDRPQPTRTVVATGRSLLSASPADHLAEALVRWLKEEDERDAQGVGELDEVEEARLAGLAAHLAQLDLVAATLDGVRSALLGVPLATVRTKDGDGNPVPPTPAGLPLLLAAGRLRLRRARLVDAFGRTLDLDVDAVTVPAEDQPAAQPSDPPVGPGSGAVLLQRPRLTRPARVRLDLVSAAAELATSATPARVDEIDPTQQENPVAGFLLPDHVDESIEVFAVDGTPLGELLSAPLGPGVVWEPAPGRPLPPDAAPGAGLDPGQRALGRLAAGMVAADAAARAAEGAVAPAGRGESALSAFLRAVDTTLWTTDPIAGAGTSAVGGIVGRPVAVVRCVLRLDVADDVSDPFPGVAPELTLDADARAQRAEVFADLARVEFPVRVGELTRTDDGVLGFVLDDDFTRVHLVDAVVADLARESGPRRGFLGPYGASPDLTTVAPIRHPYLVPDGVVRLRVGVPRLLTLLMLPGAAAHVTSGVVPRFAERLQRAWFGPGLDRLSPSVRVGPVLLDPGEVRLPHVAALGDNQVFTRRDGPTGWRDDPILAATQAALLPDTPSQLQEGWVRLSPTTDGGAASS